MLTDETLKERKWGQFPALRLVLEEKQVPSNYYGPTSASDNLFDHLVRPLKIWIVAREFGADIKRAAEVEGPEAILRDLARLEDELEGPATMFRDAATEVRRLMNELYQCRPIA